MLFGGLAGGWDGVSGVSSRSLIALLVVALFSCAWPVEQARPYQGAGLDRPMGPSTASLAKWPPEAPFLAVLPPGQALPEWVLQDPVAGIAYLTGPDAGGDRLALASPTDGVLTLRPPAMGLAALPDAGSPRSEFDRRAREAAELLPDLPSDVLAGLARGGIVNLGSHGGAFLELMTHPHQPDILFTRPPVPMAVVPQGPVVLAEMRVKPSVRVDVGPPFEGCARSVGWYYWDDSYTVGLGEVALSDDGALRWSRYSQPVEDQVDATGAWKSVPSGMTIVPWTPTTGDYSAFVRHQLAATTDTFPLSDLNGRTVREIVQALAELARIRLEVSPDLAERRILAGGGSIGAAAIWSAIVASVWGETSAEADLPPAIRGTDIAGLGPAELTRLVEERLAVNLPEATAGAPEHTGMTRDRDEPVPWDYLVELRLGLPWAEVVNQTGRYVLSVDPHGPWAAVRAESLRRAYAADGAAAAELGRALPDLLGRPVLNALPLPSSLFVDGWAGTLDELPAEVGHLVAQSAREHAGRLSLYSLESAALEQSLADGSAAVTFGFNYSLFLAACVPADILEPALPGYSPRGGDEPPPETVTLWTLEGSIQF